MIWKWFHTNYGLIETINLHDDCSLRRLNKEWDKNQYKWGYIGFVTQKWWQICTSPFLGLFNQRISTIFVEIDAIGKFLALLPGWPTFEKSLKPPYFDCFWCIKLWNTLMALLPGWPTFGKNLIWIIYSYEHFYVIMKFSVIIVFNADN